MSARDDWTLEDFLDLNGKRGAIRQARARLKHRRIEKRAGVLARAKTLEHQRRVEGRS